VDKFLTFPVWYARLIIAGLAIVGLVGVLPVSWDELISGSACPHLGPIPACHIVSVAYSLILLSVVDYRLWKPGLFIWGWLPVFILALNGSTLELWGRDTCPKTAGGWPKCFSSLALASFIILPLVVSWLIRRQNLQGKDV